jgi:hypothetical protein
MKTDGDLVIVPSEVYEELCGAVRRLADPTRMLQIPSQWSWDGECRARLEFARQVLKYLGPTDAAQHVRAVMAAIEAGLIRAFEGGPS